MIGERFVGSQGQLFDEGIKDPIIAQQERSKRKDLLSKRVLLEGLLGRTNLANPDQTVIDFKSRNNAAQEATAS